MKHTVAGSLSSAWPDAERAYDEPSHGTQAITVTCLHTGAWDMQAK